MIIVRLFMGMVLLMVSGVSVTGGRVITEMFVTRLLAGSEMVGFVMDVVGGFAVDVETFMLLFKLLLPIFLIISGVEKRAVPSRRAFFATTGDTNGGDVAKLVSERLGACTKRGLLLLVMLPAYDTMGMTVQFGCGLRFMVNRFPCTPVAEVVAIVEITVLPEPSLRTTIMRFGIVR